MSCISGLATQVVNTEFDYLTGSEITSQFNYVSGWLSANLGQLNTLLHTNFSGECPDWCQEEESIFTTLFLTQFYAREARQVLKGINNGAVDWIRLTEGDSTIIRTNKNEVAKTFRSMARESRDELDHLVKKYLSYQGAPREVGIYSAWSGVDSY